MESMIIALGFAPGVPAMECQPLTSAFLSQMALLSAAVELCHFAQLAVEWRRRRHCRIELLVEALASLVLGHQGL